MRCVAGARNRNPTNTRDGRHGNVGPVSSAAMSRVLPRIGSPSDLRALSHDELVLLSAEIRDLLVQTVSRTSGHIGPNLGAVELTIALHRVFDSPAEPILFDVGHQAYVHKILTGRADAMPTLRQTGGISGYPSRAESHHDWIENSHASTALSYADGLAKAFAVRGERRPVIAVVGDGALTGGMCWEALNNIAASDRPVIVVVNDNGRSYAPTIGGLAEHLSGLREDARHHQARPAASARGRRTDLRRVARYEARRQGSPCATRDVRGSRPQVPRPRRRPRPAFARACAVAGPPVRRARHRACRDPQGLRLRAGGERRGRPDAPDPWLRPRHRAPERIVRHVVDVGLLRR